MSVTITRDDHKGRTRRDDRITSLEGAASVAYRAGTQKEKLAQAYLDAYPDALTDEEAAREAGLLASCYWKRCGELRADGVIAETFNLRKGSSGVRRITSRYILEHEG